MLIGPLAGKLRPATRPARADDARDAAHAGGARRRSARSPSTPPTGRSARLRPHGRRPGADDADHRRDGDGRGRSARSRASRRAWSTPPARSAPRSASPSSARSGRPSRATCGRRRSRRFPGAPGSGASLDELVLGAQGGSSAAWPGRAPSAPAESFVHGVHGAMWVAAGLTAARAHRVHRAQGLQGGPGAERWPLSLRLKLRVRVRRRPWLIEV